MKNYMTLCIWPISITLQLPHVYCMAHCKQDSTAEVGNISLVPSQDSICLVALSHTRVASKMIDFLLRAVLRPCKNELFLDQATCQRMQVTRMQFFCKLRKDTLRKAQVNVCKEATIGVKTRLSPFGPIHPVCVLT